MYEDFVEFIDVHKAVFKDREASQEPKVTGELLGKLVLKKIQEFGLNVNLCDDVRKSRGRKRNPKGSIERFSLSLLQSCIKLNYFSIVKRSEHSKTYWGYKGDYCILTSSAKQRVVVDSICERKIKKTLRNKMGRADQCSCRFF
jgi:hypothetical protein